MNLTALRSTPGYWDRFAPWYERWLVRGCYHRPVIRELGQMIEPGWRVVDVGAATGALAIPLASLGCRVTAVEPARGMRALLESKLSSLDVRNVLIDGARWEEFRPDGSPDLIVSCNVLHLTEGGIARGMQKVFASGAAHACLVTEVNQGFFIDFKELSAAQDTHAFLYIRNYRVDSSFRFEDMDEVEGLQEFLGREIDVVMDEGRPVERDQCDIAVVWWERKAT